MHLVAKPSPAWAAWPSLPLFHITPDRAPLYTSRLLLTGYLYCNLPGLEAPLELPAYLDLLLHLNASCFLCSSSAGYLYCNLPGLEAPRGSNVRFVLIGMGSEADLHSPAFAGQVRTWYMRGGAIWACNGSWPARQALALPPVQDDATEESPREATLRPPPCMCCAPSQPPTAYQSSYNAPLLMLECPTPLPAGAAH